MENFDDKSRYGPQMVNILMLRVLPRPLPVSVLTVLHSIMLHACVKCFAVHSPSTLIKMYSNTKHKGFILYIAYTIHVYIVFVG